VRQSLGSDGLVAVVIGLRHLFTFWIGPTCAKKVRSRRCERSTKPEWFDQTVQK
jgi:hypothetical protein